MGLGKSEDESSKDVNLFKRYIENEEQQFIMAGIELGYIYMPGMELRMYLERPEMEVLNMIRTRGPISDVEIKDNVEHTLPVVVMRMISKLQADEVITADTNGNWLIAPRLMYLMVKDKLKQNLDEDEYDELSIKYDKN